nr:hypothetical protein [Saprospiraceae bacterium]
MKSSFICNCTLSIVMLAMGFLHLHAQPAPCSGSAEGIYLHGNQVRAFINNSGTLFLDEEGAAFQVPFQFPKKATIYAQGLWLAGYGPDGNLRVAAPTYSINSEDFEYFPGPLDSPGQSTAEQCANWNRVWTVSRYQIEAHLADFGDNGIIDSPLPEILGWPGKGNPHFQEIYGFELPDTPQGLAPFFDQNGDGSYTPLAGDYPMVSQAVVIPEQITWGVFNDAAGPHAESGGEPLQVEVQLTCWAFSCRENRQLDHTIFTSYKLINRSGGTIDSLLTSFWHDFDLGCFWDDHLGTAPSSNTVFTYNHNNLDGSALTGCSEENSYGENPPVQAMTVLNHALSSSLIYFRTGGVDTSPGMMSPALPEQYFRCLNGKWRDGEPITTFSCGYNPGQDYPITTFSFSGDPNDPNAWASNNTTCLPYEQHMLPGINLGTFLPDSVQIIDLAYSFFLEPGANYLGNVTSMYDGVENLQAWYDQQFSGICTPPDCEADCVWAGDTNSDGIANHLDVLPIGIALGSQGPERTTPANWSPQPGPDWPEAQYNGANFKHIDADGDGQVRSGDLGFTLLHYERTQPGYEAEAVYPEGPELFAAPSPNVDFSNLPTGLPNFAIYIELAQVP